MLHAVHSSLGHTLLGIAVLGAIIALFARNPRGGARRAAVLFMRLFAIVLSLQWLTGLIIYFSIPSAGRPGLVHPLIMTLVLALAHMVSGRARKDQRFGYGNLVVTAALLAVFIYFGIGFA